MRIAFIAATIAVLAWMFQVRNRPGAYVGARPVPTALIGLGAGDAIYMAARARVNINFDNLALSATPPVPVAILVRYGGKQGFGWADFGHDADSAYGHGARASMRQLPISGRSAQKAQRALTPVSFRF